jgi:hypothetical protein
VLVKQAPAGTSMNQKKKKKNVENEEHHNEDGTMVHTQLMPLAMTACPAHDRHMEEKEG